jgi:Helix-hairpin-helix motif
MIPRKSYYWLGRLSLALCLSFAFANSSAQEYYHKEFNLEKLVDDIFPLQDLDLNYEELYENLVQILANPIDLNRASDEQLRSLFILKENQIESLLAYREETGSFLSVYELQSIPNLDPATLSRLIPFVTVENSMSFSNKSLLKRIAGEKNNYLILRYERTLEEKKGYKTSIDSAVRYQGTPDKMYARFRTARSGDFSFGFTLEKDAGETINPAPSKKQYGPDYASFHGQVLNKGRIKNIIIGDYQAQFGQGLMLGGGFGMGKGAETITTIRRSNLGFIPYASLNEFGFFRGAAVTYSLAKNVSLHSFASSYRRDGNPVADTLDDSSFIASLPITGFHRTPGELLSRKQIREDNAGIVLQYKAKSIDGGVLFHHTDFSLPINRNPSLYNQFSFTGKSNTNLGGYINYTTGNFTVFSEAARTLEHGRAFTIGALSSLSNQLDISLLYRNFSRDFYSFYSNALSENTIPQNESGFYWGSKYTFSKKYSLAGYVDLFRFPWLKYRGYSPSDGSEWMVKFNYQPSKTVNFFLQAREETKTRNSSEETNLYRTAIGTKRNYWINCDYEAGQRLSFKTRAQLSSYSLDGTTTKGFALIQDVNFDIGRFSFSTRYALFDTDNYDNRLYVYEKDVWLAFSLPAYFGQGIRNYVMVQYKVSSKVDLWLRWAQTHYTNQDTIGTGNETITGNIKNDVKLQAKISL